MSTDPVPDNFQCFLSQATSEPFDGPHEDARTGDKLGGLPLGWTRITVERRLPNPEWMSLMEAKQAIFASQAAQMQQLGEAQGVPAELIEAQVSLIGFQLDATFYPQERDTPLFVLEREVVYVDTMDPAVLVEFNGVREELGLEPLAVHDEEGGESSEPSAE